MLEAPEILRVLADHRVEYVVIGGLAMITHGSSHVTDDLDICYRRSRDNVERLAAALGPLRPELRGAPPGLPFTLDARTILSGLNFTLMTTLGPLDIIGEVAGIGDHDAVLSRSEEHEIFDLRVQVLSLEGLIDAKKAAGRRKDQLHLLELEELKKLRDSAG